MVGGVQAWIGLVYEIMGAVLHVPTGICVGCPQQNGHVLLGLQGELTQVQAEHAKHVQEQRAEIAAANQKLTETSDKLGAEQARSRSETRTGFAKEYVSLQLTTCIPPPHTTCHAGLLQDAGGAGEPAGG